MSNKSNFLEFLNTRKRVEKVKFLDIEMNVKVFSVNEMKKIDIQEKNNEAASFLAEQFLDIETGELIFTPELILDKLTQKESANLFEIFLNAQGVFNKDDKEIEKN